MRIRINGVVYLVFLIGLEDIDFTVKGTEDFNPSDSIADKTLELDITKENARELIQYFESDRAKLDKLVDGNPIILYSLKEFLNDLREALDE